MRRSDFLFSLFTIGLGLFLSIAVSNKLHAESSDSFSVTVLSKKQSKKAKKKQMQRRKRSCKRKPTKQARRRCRLKRKRNASVFTYMSGFSSAEAAYNFTPLNTRSTLSEYGIVTLQSGGYAEKTEQLDERGRPVFGVQLPVNMQTAIGYTFVEFGGLRYYVIRNSDGRVIDIPDEPRPQLRFAHIACETDTVIKSAGNSVFVSIADNGGVGKYTFNESEEDYTFELIGDGQNLGVWTVDSAGNVFSNTGVLRVFRPNGTVEAVQNGEGTAFVESMWIDNDVLYFHYSEDGNFERVRKIYTLTVGESESRVELKTEYTDNAIGGRGLQCLSNASDTEGNVKYTWDSAGRIWAFSKPEKRVEYLGAIEAGQRVAPYGNGVAVVTESGLYEVSVKEKKGRKVVDLPLHVSAIIAKNGKLYFSGVSKKNGQPYLTQITETGEELPIDESLPVAQKLHKIDRKSKAQR